MTIHIDEVAGTSRPSGNASTAHNLQQEEAGKIDVLFREARQRRRRRWTVVVIALALVAATVAVVANRGGSRTSPPATLHSAAKPGTAAIGSRSRSGSEEGPLHYTPVQEIGLADPGVSWALNGAGVYLTTNGGRTWRTITPPLIKLGDPVEDFDSLVGIGSKDLWMPVNDVFGVIPPGDDVGAYRRAAGIEDSTDGGQTWTFNTLVPGCLVTCGADSVSFIDAEHGFAAGETSLNGPTTVMYRTADGGVTWQPVATIPGGGAHDITFTSTEDGWAITGPTRGTIAQNQGQITDPGGTLYRTTDGGTTWSLAPGLPAMSRYQLPTFFNHEQGVVLAKRQGKGSKVPLVYVTHDGGATWTARSLPNEKAVATYSTNPPFLDEFAFSPISPSAWKLYIGPYLYTTNNGGHVWTRSVPTPRLTAGSVFFLVFSSTWNGLAVAMPPGCLPSPGYQASERCTPSLIETADGGKHWTAASP